MVRTGHRGRVLAVTRPANADSTPSLPRSGAGREPHRPDRRGSAGCGVRFPRRPHRLDRHLPGTLAAHPHPARRPPRHRHHADLLADPVRLGRRSPPPRRTVPARHRAGRGTPRRRHRDRRRLARRTAPQPNPHRRDSDRDRHRHPRHGDRPHTAPTPPTPNPSPPAAPPTSPPPSGGLALGLLQGTFGVGGGFLLLPFLVLALRVPTRLAVAATLFAGIPSLATAAISHLLLGNVQPAALTALLVGALPLARLGARTTGRIPPAKVRYVVLALLSLSCIAMTAAAA